MNSRDLTVVIDSFNCAPFIADAIESVLSQTALPGQVIVSDASSDETAEIVRALASSSPLVETVHSENQGQLATICAALPRIKGRVVLFLDGDDRYQAEHVTAMLQRWRGFPHADVIYCRHRLIGDEKAVAGLRRRQDHENAKWMGPFDLEAPYDWGWSTALAWCDPDYHGGGVNSCLSFRVDHLQRLPLAQMVEDLGIQLAANADYMLLLASALYGGRKIYVPDRTVDYRVHKESLTAQYADGNPVSDYQQRRHCALARNWLCDQRQFGPALFGLLRKEMACVPELSRGHRKLYRRAMRRALLPLRRG